MVAGASGNGSYVNVGVGETKRLSLTVTPTATGSVTALYLLRQNNSVAGQIKIRKLLFEEANAVQPYYDGDNTTDPDAAPWWNGTPGASTSGLYAAAIPNTYHANGARIARSAVDTTPALRLIPVDPPSTEGWAVVAGAPGSGMSGGGITFIPGRTYTVVARCYLPAPQGVSVGSSRVIQVVGNNKAGWATATLNLYSTRAPNAAGWSTHRITFTVAEDTVWCGIRLGGGSGLGTGDVYWLDLAVVEGVYDGAAFDGDSPACAWRGTAHDSPTVGYPAA